MNLGWKGKGKYFQRVFFSKSLNISNVLEFLPADDAEKKTPIVLTVDEYETIRLLDKKGYSQEPVSYTHLDVYKRQDKENYL